MDGQPLKQVRIEPACLAHASFIAANMREADAREIYCQVPDGTKSYEIAGMLLHSGDAFIAYLDDLPVMFFGAHPTNVCTLEAWAIGTAKTRRVLHAATRYMLTNFADPAVSQGYLSMECRSHVDHVEAHRWLESTGAIVNGTPFVYGKSNEKFVLYRWDRDAIATARQRYKVNHERHA